MPIKASGTNHPNEDKRSLKSLPFRVLGFCPPLSPPTDGRSCGVKDKEGGAPLLIRSSGGGHRWEGTEADHGCGKRSRLCGGFVAVSALHLKPATIPLAELCCVRAVRGCFSYQGNLSGWFFFFFAAQLNSRPLSPSDSVEFSSQGSAFSSHFSVARRHISTHTHTHTQTQPRLQRWSSVRARHQTPTGGSPTRRFPAPAPLSCFAASSSSSSASESRSEWGCRPKGAQLPGGKEA